MAHATHTLVVLTLLQLCRAEISDKLPEWYSANIINDAGYSPKPISEIFTTQPTFSSTNPIVVLPTSAPKEADTIKLLSSLSPDRPTKEGPVSTQDVFGKVLPLESTAMTPQASSQEPERQSTFQPVSQSTETQTPQPTQPQPTRPQPTIPQSPQTRQTQPQTDPVQSQPQPTESTPQSQQPQESIRSESTPAPPTIIQLPPQIIHAPPQIVHSPPQIIQPPPQIIELPPQIIQSPPQFIPGPPQIVESPAQIITAQSGSLPQPGQTQSRSMQSQSQQIQLELVAPTQLPIQIPNLPEPQSPTQQPNYFLIYQQAPQTIQHYPLPLPQPGPIASSPPPPPITNAPATSPQTVRTTSQRPVTSRPRSTQAETRPTSVSPRTRSTTTPPSVTMKSETLNSSSSPMVLGPYPNLRIRLIAPPGSITNLKINPPTTTTTRKPTTTRTRKPKRCKKNNYDSCIEACKGRKDPICAAPLGATPIDSKTLKGFPSICHMACHNSFRKDPYEKLVDGRCGRLRTRIQTVDSNTKLKRDELNKAQYTVIQENGPNTIVEFTPLRRS